MKRIGLLLIMLMALGKGAAWAQTTNMITGRVLDERGQGLPSATITVKGAQDPGAVTDYDGNFRIAISSNATLVIQVLGYATREVSASGASNIRMQVASRELNGAVFTALAIRREKRELGYSATTLSSEDLTSGNNVSALSAIQGKTAGVNITSTTGGPGGSTRVVLRGEKSLTGNNNALIVVDGIVTNNNARLPLDDSRQQLDFGNQGNDINPDDIELITVLKGPAAAALYGSEGSNGAIMITTKSGRNRKGNKKTEITVNSTFTVSEVLRLPEYQDEFGQGNIYVGAYPDDRRENFSWGAKYDGQVRPWGQVINGHQKVKPYSAQPDNIKSFYKKGLTSENYISLAGGDNKSNYFLSLNALNNTGVIPHTFYNKYGVRFNASTELTNKFYSNVSINYININSRIESSGQATGAVTSALNQTPRDIPIEELKDLSDPYNAYGTLDESGVARYGYYNAYYKNPYWLAENYDNRSKTDRVLGAVTLGYKANKYFNILDRVSADVNTDRFTLKTPKYDYSAYDPLYGDNRAKSNGGFTQTNVNNLRFNNDLITQYNRDLNEDLNFDVLLGHNMQIRNNTSVSGEINPASNGLVIPDYYNLANAQGPVTTSNSVQNLRKYGLYGDIKIGYKRELFLEITGRNDWSSTLAAENRSYFYPSVNASWIFTEALKDKMDNSILNYGKLRAGYASVGNDAGIYQNNNAAYVSNSEASGYGISTGFGTTNFPFSSQPGFTLQNTIGNPNLKPERTNSYEVGLEMSLLKSRLSIEATYYYSRTIDQIFNVPAPPSTGYTSRVVNLGEVENKGIELAVRATPISTASGLKVELFGTYYKNKNEVISLANGVSQISIGGFSGLTIAAAVGKPYGALYAIDLLRDKAGHVIIDTTTGKPLNTSTTVYKGSFQPRFIASWGTTIRYKGFAFNVLFDTKQGGYFYSHTKRNLDFNGTAAETDANDRKESIWPNSVYETTPGNYETNISYKYLPYDFYTNDAQNISGIHIIDASYIKLREASLYYTLPAKLFEGKYIGGVTLGIFGNNLLLWTPKENKYTDPEMSSGGSTNEQGDEYESRQSLRNYGISLKVSF